PGTYYTSLTKPGGGPKIAVVDTGIDVGGTDSIPHPDFINAGGTSCDAALGGQIDIADSRNVISGGTPSNFADDFGHGTAVAGVIGASTNNGGSGDGEGIAGLAYNCQLVSIKTFDNTGNGTAADTASAILWAVDHGALVVNISAGDVFYSQAEQDAVDYAWEHGTLVVAAAGNEGDGANRTFYPAACNGALGVGATDMNDSTASYSNTGEYVGISAPGGDISYFPLGAWLIWTTMPTEDVPLKQLSYPDTGMYSYETGTSMACPFVAGLAGLYASRFGITQGTAGGVLRMYQALQRGSENAAGIAGWSPNWGWGRINAQQTLLDANYRGSSVGCITGQLIYIDTVAPNKEVQAKVAGTSTVVATTTTRSDGMFRFANLTPGNYDLTATYFGQPGLVSNVPVIASADTPHVEILIGGDTNDPPTPPSSVAISPAEPTGDDNLVATAEGSIDPDGTTPSYLYEWAKWDSGLGDWGAWGSPGQTLDKSKTAPGDQWKARAQATDGQAASIWVESASVTVSNATPTVPTKVTITPAKPTGDDNLTATAEGSTDPDGTTPTYSYEWSKWDPDTSLWSEWGYAGAVVDKSLTASGEKWKARAKATDGSSSSAWLESASVTIDNTAPTAPTTVTISPYMPGREDMKATASGAADLNQDTLTYQYQWSKKGTDGAWEGWIYKGDTLAGAYVRVNEIWGVRARAYDGSVYGPWKLVATRIYNMAGVTPAPNTYGVAVTTSVFVSFRWPVQQSTVTTRVQLKLGTTKVIPTVMTWATAERKVKLRPKTALLPNTYYRINIDPGIVCTSGRVLGWGENYWFKTAAATTTASVSVAAAPTAAGAQVTVNLSAAATVRTVICNLAGRVVAELAERDLPAGVNSLVWNGRGNNGTRVPAGSYLVRVEAKGAEGQLTSAMVAVQMR
ncbi:MAG: S8 family serine peptidase, partial [Armatimonadia bacterium]